jgi:hypothetical protein
VVGATLHQLNPTDREVPAVGGAAVTAARDTVKRDTVKRDTLHQGSR